MSKVATVNFTSHSTKKEIELNYVLDNLANTGCPKKSDFQNAAGAAVHRLNQWWPAGKIVIHAQDLRILKSLGFEEP